MSASLDFEFAVYHGVLLTCFTAIFFTHRPAACSESCYELVGAFAYCGKSSAQALLFEECTVLIPFSSSFPLTSNDGKWFFPLGDEKFVKPDVSVNWVAARTSHS